ncbi:hypothetical protein ACOME3_006242 [Neoechinorhynchus agilis]
MRVLNAMPRLEIRVDGKFDLVRPGSSVSMSVQLVRYSLGSNEDNKEGLPLSQEVFCPLYPARKKESWWIYVLNKRTHELLSPVYYVADDTLNPIEVRFRAPMISVGGGGKVVHVALDIVIRSDSYVGLDRNESFKIGLCEDVKDEEEQISEIDEEEEEEEEMSDIDEMNPDNIDLMTEATERLSKGEKYLEECELESACNELAKACEILCKIHGEISPNCLRALMLYGSSLLALGRKENEVLKSLPTEARNGETELQDEKQQEEDDDIDEEDDEESNLKLALTIYELCLKICDAASKMVKCHNDVIEVEIAKSDCLLRKSEILQELDAFEDAVACCRESVQILSQCQAEDVNRLRAESYYFLGITLDNLEKHADAIEALTLCVTCLDAQIAKIVDEESIEDLKELKSDVEGRILDIKMASDAGIQDYLKKLSAEGKTLSNMSKEEASKTITDLTARIKKLPVNQLTIATKKE